jgi:hypothetical protein
VDESEKELMARILAELQKINHQLNPRNYPTFAGEVSRQLTAIEKRLERIEKSLEKP